MRYLFSRYLSLRPFLLAAAPEYFVVTLPGGAKVPMRPNAVDCETVRDMFEERVYDVQAVDVKRVLDLGGNIGAATLFLHSLFPKAEFGCVEPFPGNYALLKETLRLNGIRAKVFEGVVGIEPGEAELDLGAGADGFSLAPAQSSGNTLRVKQFTVEQLMQELGWSEVDIVKIDIEGYEKVLLRQNNGWLRKVGLIVGEAHGHAGYGIAEVRADLEPLGFTVTQRAAVPEHGLTIFEARRAK